MCRQVSRLKQQMSSRKADKGIRSQFMLPERTPSSLTEIRVSIFVVHMIVSVVTVLFSLIVY